MNKRVIFILGSFTVLIPLLVLLTTNLSSAYNTQQEQLSPNAVNFSEKSNIAQSSIYYIRIDGGSNTQCNGQVDAPYPGAGTSQDCAWDHPFRAFPPGGSAQISAGDTLIIGSGSYKVGYGAPDPQEYCYPEGAFDCYMAQIPSGPDALHPTRILGEGWDSNCQNPPELWGTQRVNMILNMEDASNVEIGCLDITDHSGCVEFHSGGLSCQRDTYPYGDWASVGIYAEDSANVYLHDLDIHGLANSGVHAGRLTDWTIEDVRIAANGWAGWDGDLWEGVDSNSGTMDFNDLTIEWNGCAETYPGEQPTGCWAQSAGGYGDGLGTGETGGDWKFENSAFLHNTSDGLDLLYHTLGGHIILNRVRSEGNAGNQVKVTGMTTITNSIMVGNCAFFDDQTFTYNVDACRALGNTLEVHFTGGEDNSIVNTSIYGQGDGLVFAGHREGFTCNGTESITGSNNIFLGDGDYFDSEDQPFLFYQEGCGNVVFKTNYNIAYNVKNYQAQYVQPPFPSAHNTIQDPTLSGPFSGNEYGMTLSASSPSIDTGDNNTCPSDDFLGISRPQDGDNDGDATCDLGAYEYWQLEAEIYLPLVIKNQ